jgi:hypothetical protein
MRRGLVQIATFALIGGATSVLAPTSAQASAPHLAPAAGSGSATVYLVQGVEATTMG